MNTIRYIDDNIEKTKRNEKIGWIIAGFGLLTVATGFLIADAIVFVVGVFPLTFGAISTSHFENKRNNLVKQRRQIAI